MSPQRSDNLTVLKGGAELGEVLDIGAFQQRLARIRARNQEVLENAPSQRAQLEAALLEQTLGEEHAMLDRLETIERNLRNMIRLYRQLMDERNAMCGGLTALHSWIRQMELKQGKTSHADHSVDLAQQSFVEYLSKQAWIFDNQNGWELEKTPRRRRSSTARD